MNYADRVQETTTATSTTTVTLAGAVAGYRTAAAAFAVGTTGILFGVSDAAGNWEIATYTLTDVTTLTREAVLASSNNNAAVVFPAGSKNVFCTATADLLQRGLVNPDDIGYRIVGYIGQSNAEGRGGIDSLIELPDPRVWQFGSDSRDARYRTIFAGNDPNHNTYFAGWSGNGVNTGQMSMMTVACKVYASTLPSHLKVLYVPLAVGGTTLVASTAPWAVGNALEELSIVQINAAIVAAKALYPNSRYVGTIMHQGEGDAGNSITQAAYTAGLTALIADIRARVTGASNSWFVIGGMVPEAVNLYGANWTSINNAHQAVAASTPRCAYVAGPSGYTPDNLHYNAAGARIIGTRLGLAIRTAQLSTGVDTTAPFFVSAQVANSDPTKIIITMSEALAASSPAASAYTPSGGKTATTTPVISGATITITASSAYVYGDPITVQYTKPGSGAMLQDAGGNLTASFGPSSVTNNIATVPGAPTGVTASAGNAQATVSFAAPASSGGAAITGYTVTASTGQSATGSVSPITVTGLTNGTPVTFTVHATNSVGNSVESSASASVTPAPSTAPGVPTIGTATAGNASASVAFTAPASTGGSAITGYTVTSTPGGFTGTGTASPISVPGLTNGIAYTFTVHATNSVGNSVESAASNSVTPTAAAAAIRALAGFTGFTEGGSAPNWAYTGTGGAAFDATGAVMDKSLASGAVGSLSLVRQTAPQGAGSQACLAMIIGTAPLASGSRTALLYHSAAGLYAVQYNGSALTPLASLTAAVGDIMRIGVSAVNGGAGTCTITYEVSQDGGTSYTVLASKTGVPVNAFHFQLQMLGTGTMGGFVGVGLS